MSANSATRFATLIIPILSLATTIGAYRLNAQGAPPPPAPMPATAVSSLRPYTPQERLKEALRRTTGVEALLFSAMSAGIGQARNAPSAWEQGAEGFGRRFGSSMAQRAVASSIQFAAEWGLGEDSRYVPSERSGVGQRVGEVVKHSLLIRGPNGSSHFPLGVLAGCLGGGLISRTWQPGGHDKISQGFASGAYSFGFYLGTNAFAEFWPSVRKRLHF